MTSLLVNHILQTEKWTSPELFETKNRIYTFLNPVSYLIALENKSLFEQIDGIFSDGPFGNIQVDPGKLGRIGHQGI